MIKVEKNSQRGPRISPTQKQYLIQFVEEHPILVEKKFTSTNTYESMEALWKKLTEQLNRMGVQKDVNGWKKCWSDIKKKTKHVAAAVMKERTGTGGGGAILQDLSPTKERIMTLIGGKVAAVGDGKVSEFGSNITLTSTMETPKPTKFEKYARSLSDLQSQISNQKRIKFEHMNSQNHHISKLLENQPNDEGKEGTSNMTPFHEPRGEQLLVEQILSPSKYQKPSSNQIPGSTRPEFSREKVDSTNNSNCVQKKKQNINVQYVQELRVQNNLLKERVELSKKKLEIQLRQATATEKLAEEVLLIRQTICKYLDQNIFNTLVEEYSLSDTVE